MLRLWYADLLENKLLFCRKKVTSVRRAENGLPTKKIWWLTWLQHTPTGPFTPVMRVENHTNMNLGFDATGRRTTMGFGSFASNAGESLSTCTP